jgi:transposase
LAALEHPPYSPDLVPADFYLFSQLKSALKWRRFCDATEVTNATEELKRFLQNGFHECLQHLYSL